jgi:Uma2 family endonuclease
MMLQTKTTTYDDYRSLPDDGNRYEIIGGELLMSPSPTSYHQIISFNLALKLRHYVDDHKLGRVLYAPLDVVLSMRDVVQPDLMYISSERMDIIADNNIVEAPDLVIEITSEGTQTIDRTRKKSLYEKYGVREYWIVDPIEKTVEQFIGQSDKSFERKAKAKKTQLLVSTVIKGFTLSVEEVFSTQ